MSKATLANVGPRPTLRFERRLARPTAAVWQAITDPKEMQAWFPTRIEIEGWHVGAKMTHHFDQHDAEPLTGTVVEWEPPRRVSFTWGTDTIGFDLTEAPDGNTVFVLTDELSAQHAARNAAGWDGCLDRLQIGSELETWQSRFDRYVAAFEPTLGHQHGPPEGFR